MLRITLASLHLLALAIGLMATVMRGSALREPFTPSSLKRALRMDVIWGIAAALWHLGQWIALVLVSSVVLSAALVTIAIAQGLPPESDAEKRLKRMLAISTHRDHRRQ